MKGICGCTAVIELGSTGVRLLIAEVLADGSWKILDEAGKPAALGRDVFTSGKVSRDSFLECLAVLRAFNELLASWKIKSADAVCIATSALRVAHNRDVFVDRIRQETGFNFIIVEGIEENRLMYLTVRYALKNTKSDFFSTNSMIIDVGGGSTEIMLLRQGSMVAAHSLKFGTITIGEQSRLVSHFTGAHVRYIVEMLHDTQDFLNIEMDLANISTFIATGVELRITSLEIGSENNKLCRTISRESFLEFSEKIKHYTIEECIEKLHIPFTDASGFIPAIMIYRYFFEHTRAESIIVPQISMREGLLIDLSNSADGVEIKEFYDQIIDTVYNFGRKYSFDEAHSRHVTSAALTLFDALQSEHGLKKNYRLLFQVASILHDIGMFTGESGHQKHGCYILKNSEIFGLKSSERAIIAQVVRCHRGKPPNQDDKEIAAFNREDRMFILKAASLLRIADALDRSHDQRIKSFTVEKKNGTLILHPQNKENSAKAELSLERLGIQQKGDMFEDVFWYKVLLEQD